MDVRARRAWGIWVLSASFYMEGTTMKDFLAQKLRSPCLLPLCFFFLHKTHYQDPEIIDWYVLGREQNAAARKSH